AAPAASRSGQDLHRASIGLRSLVSIIGLRSLVSIDSIIAASSPLPRRRLSPALASMAARAGVGNRHRGAGSESGPATTTMGTTKRSLTVIATPVSRVMPMASKDAEEYRHLAQQCRATARMVSTGEGRTNLLAMAEVWERLADQQDQGSDLTEVRGPPPAREQSAVRQQQIQPKDEEKKRIGCATKSLANEVKQNPAARRKRGQPG